MQRAELENILNELKEELAGSEFADTASEQELVNLIVQIEEVLHEDDLAIQAALNEPINDAVTRFESSHPQLTALLNNISTLLSNMGI